MSEKSLIKIVNAIICDDVRKEITNKFIIIGVYSNDIVFPSFPSNANLSLYSDIFIRKQGDFTLNVRILLDGKMIIGAEVQAQNNKPEQLTSLILPPMTMSFPNECTLSFEISHDNKTWIRLASRRVIKGKTVSVVNVLPSPVAS